MKVIPEVRSVWNLNNRVVEVVSVKHRTKGHVVSYIGANEDYKPDEIPTEMACAKFTRKAKPNPV